MALSVGEKIDRYEIQGVLGEGGMGEVYRAYDERLHRSVALKVLKPPVARRRIPCEGLDARDRRRGAHAPRGARGGSARAPERGRDLRRRRDFVAGGSARTTYIAMELVRGTSLRPVIRAGATTLATRVRWLVEIAMALAAAHKSGLVHRDVKPENVMIREDGVAKVLDFGIAKKSHTPADPSAATEALVPTITTQGVILGTPYYMSPEQAPERERRS